jgi:hypothetical protein
MNVFEGSNGINLLNILRTAFFLKKYYLVHDTSNHYINSIYADWK